jgi:mannan polymerase II complex MNN11 subunit
MRHAMTLYPHSTWYFYLDANAFFMKPRVSVQQQITSDHHLESLLIPDRSIVPPDSVIRTFKHKSASHVDLVMTQDHSSLSDDSFLVRRGPWAHFFLDSWYDPLYRSYNFQDAQAHALEHLVQWHVSVLSRLALVPQRVMNSYTHGEKDDEEKYHDGDFIANLHGCQADDTRDCDQEAKPFYEHFASILRSG